jgi:hypothetical protein
MPSRLDVCCRRYRVVSPAHVSTPRQSQRHFQLTCTLRAVPMAVLLVGIVVACCAVETAVGALVAFDFVTGATKAAALALVERTVDAQASVIAACMQKELDVLAAFGGRRVFP